jgi:septal ring factor EnvC (AmiA/AmiB activator)
MANTRPREEITDDIKASEHRLAHLDKQLGDLEGEMMVNRKELEEMEANHQSLAGKREQEAARLHGYKLEYESSG